MPSLVKKWTAAAVLVCALIVLRTFSLPPPQDNFHNRSSSSNDDIRVVFSKTQSPIPNELASNSPRYDWIPHNLSLGKKYPSCGGPLNRTEIVQTLHQPPWNDMKWKDGIEHKACGWYKCFLSSKSHPDRGYLISPPFLFSSMMKAHRVQQKLSRRSTHILAIPEEPPEIKQIPESMACLIVDQFGYNVHRKRILEKNRVLVYAQQRAPEPNLLLGVVEEKRSQFQQWAHFIKDNHANATAAYQQLTREFVKMDRAVEKFPRLACDWQVLTDVHGNLYHMDVDRMFVPWSTDRCEGAKREIETKEYKQQIPHFLKTARIVARDYEKKRGIFAV